MGATAPSSSTASSSSAGRDAQRPPADDATVRMRNGDFGEAFDGRQLAVDPLGRPIMKNPIYDPRTDAASSTARSEGIRFPQRDSTRAPGSGGLEDSGHIPRATRTGMINNWDQSFPADTIKSISTISSTTTSRQQQASGYYSLYWGPHYNAIVRLCRSHHKRYGISRPPPTLCV